jgi:Na+/H+ antiporter NhaA
VHDDWRQGCQIFLGPKYQNGEKYTNLPQNIPNDLKIFLMAIYVIDQMVIKYTKIFHSKTQIAIFGLKTNHLATLIDGDIVFVSSRVRFWRFWPIFGAKIWRFSQNKH